jgi:hypothetical protein
MTETIQPFHRTANRFESARSGSAWWTLRVMLLHFTLTGIALFVGALILVGLVYSDLSKIDLSAGLRIANPGDIYARGTQIKLAGAVALALLSLIPFRAVRNLGQRRQGGIGLARLTGLMLLAGFPASFIVWRMVANLPDSPGDMTTVQQVINDVSWAVLILAGLLLLQSLLAVWYQIWLSLPGVRRQLGIDEVPANPLLARLRTIGIGLWLVVMIGLGVALGVLTDWLYEIPVPKPEPGQLLYATSFDAFNDEWDLYPGRDSAQIVPASSLESLGASSAVTPLSGDVLAIKYGSGSRDQAVWSTLDRKFSDFDLRVTTQLIAGPVDQSQYGVIFRYRDLQDLYAFFITSDGYYSLAKRENGTWDDVSVWGQTDAIRQGSDAANEVRVIARGDEFRFFVNGQPVPLCLKGENRFSMWQGPGVCVEGGELTTVYRDSAFKQGRIALAVGTIDGSDIEVAFDDLVIVGPEATEAQ